MKEQFLALLQANEDDTLGRLMYADWLEEQGEHEEAERQRKWPAAKATLMALAKSTFGWDDPEDQAYQDAEAYKQMIYFLERHVDKEYHLPFDTPYDFDSYSDEMWEAFKIITGKEPPPVGDDDRVTRPPFSCGC